MKKILLFTSPMLVILLVFATCKDDEQMIELSANIKNFINTNYAGYEIEESEQDTLCNGATVYEVELKGSNDQKIELTFDTEGNLLFTETEISNSQLPLAVTNSISVRYPGYATKEANRLTATDGSIRFEVEVKKGPSKFEVLFAADGTFICEEIGDDDGE